MSEQTIHDYIQESLRRECQQVRAATEAINEAARLGFDMCSAKRAFTGAMDAWSRNQLTYAELEAARQRLRAAKRACRNADARVKRRIAAIGRDSSKMRRIASSLKEEWAAAAAQVTPYC